MATESDRDLEQLRRDQVVGVVRILAEVDLDPVDPAVEVGVASAYRPLALLCVLATSSYLAMEI